MATTLIVDDEPDIRFLIQTLIDLANDGLAVVAEAPDGAAAIEQWRRHRPDIVVLDQQMPEMSGLQVAEVILAENPQQAIVVYTAFLDDLDLDFAGSLGIRHCVAKGDFSRLLAVLRELTF